MRLPIAAAVTAASLLTACSQTAQNATPKTDDEKAAYSMGVIVAERSQLQAFALNDQEVAMLKAGLADAASGKPKISLEDIEKMGPQISEFAKAHAEAAGKKIKEEGVAYLAKAEKEKGATKLPSGVIVKITQEGTGAQPVATDTVKVNYEGKLINGQVFDSSAKHGGPTELPLGGVVPCWTEGFQQLKVGAKAQLVCPSEQAYGEQGREGIPGNSVLIFDVELLEIVKAVAAPAVPGAAAADPHKAH